MAPLLICPRAYLTTRAWPEEFSAGSMLARFAEMVYFVTIRNKT
jgi:hypothetical protein